MIHGDLKGVRLSHVDLFNCLMISFSRVCASSKQPNVLVDANGNARLADFGRAKLMDHRGYTTSFAGSIRWLAPELIDYQPETPTNDVDEIDNQDWIPQLTKQTDVYALGMVLLEVRCRYIVCIITFTYYLHNL